MVEDVGGGLAVSAGGGRGSTAVANGKGGGMDDNGKEEEKFFFFFFRKHIWAVRLYLTVQIGVTTEKISYSCHQGIFSIDDTTIRDIFFYPTVNG